MMNPLAYVISLRRAEERFEHVRRLVQHCPLACNRWDAVDGKLLTEAEIASVYHRDLHRPRYPFPL
ncbi:MAG: glycosyl transferase, partial [Planctomycetaceae bacterium]